MKLRRLSKDGTLEDTITKLSEGNPGALHVCLESCTLSTTIDPDNLLGCHAPLETLDTFGIYGSRIWILYKYICGEDLVKFLAVLRGLQLGIVDAVKLRTLLDAEEHIVHNIDVNDILKKVQQRLPRFKYSNRR